MAPPSRDYWLGFFRGAGDNIFDAIDAAITVAAADRPGAFRGRRDAIAERLYTALLVTGATAAAGGPSAAAAAAGAAAGGTPVVGAPTPAQLHPEGAASVPSLCSSDRGEAVTADAAPPRRDESVLAEAERIKAILLNDQAKSEDALLELLTRLQQLDLTMDTLEATAIGKAVGIFRKHSSKQIRNLVRSLIEGWKHTVDVYLTRCRDAVVDHTPQSMGPSSLEQEDRGAPSTTMDDGALFATPSTCLRLSEENPGSMFSDGMDDGGSIRNEVGRDGGQRYPMSNEPVRRPPSVGLQSDPEQSWRQEQSVKKEQFIAEMLARPSNAESGHGRPQVRPRMHNDASPGQGRPQSTSSDKPVIHHDENSVRAKLELAKNAKLEAAKRKLQEGYQEYDNAKKQRTVQMVDPQNLPKQGNRNFQPSGKPRNNNSNVNSNRNWSR